MRVIRRQPLQVAAAVACIAIGIGATTAIFSVANALLLRPLPYPNGDRLAQISVSRTENSRLGVVSYLTFKDYATRQRAFQYFAAVAGADVSVSGDGTADRVRAGLVVGDFFDALGASPEDGRLLAAVDDAPDRESVIVVSHAFATRDFGQAAKALDQKVLIDGIPRRIIGVLPDRWRYPSSADLWMPVSRRPGVLNPNDRNLVMIGALAAGMSLDAARQNIAAVSTQLAHDQPDREQGDRAYITPLRDVVIGDAGTACIAMMIGAFLVLLVACANVAALQLARATARVREIAIRAAIGARHGRLMRQLLIESLLLSLVGGAIGFGSAFAARKFAGAAVISGAPSWMTFDLDVRVLAFALVMSMASGIVFGIMPALRLSRLDPAVALRGGTGSTVAHAPVQRAFVGGELTLAIVLSVSAIMAIQSARAIQRIPTGVDPNGVMLFEIALQGPAYKDAAPRVALVTALEQRLRAIPGVTVAGATTYAPLTKCCSQFPARIEGQSVPDNALPAITGNIVTPGFLDAMGIQLVEGRQIQSTDDATAPPVTIIDETFARRYWPAGDALGKHVNTGAGYSEIVGIVRDVKQGSLFDPPEPQFYRPFAQDPWTHMNFAVRTRGGDPARIVPDVRRIVHELDPTVPIYSVSSMNDVVDAARASRRTFGELLIAFAVIALSLAATGVYALASFFVVQRRRELALRVALGAAPAAVTGLVLRQTALLAAAAAVVGTTVAAIGARWLAHTLYGVTEATPTIYLLAITAIAGASLAATFAPARRASRIDPMLALKGEP